MVSPSLEMAGAVEHMQRRLKMGTKSCRVDHTLPEAFQCYRCSRATAMPWIFPGFPMIPHRMPSRRQQHRRETTNTKSHPHSIPWPHRAR